MPSLRNTQSQIVPCYSRRSCIVPPHPAGQARTGGNRSTNYRLQPPPPPPSPSWVNNIPARSTRPSPGPSPPRPFIGSLGSSSPDSRASVRPAQTVRHNHLWGEKTRPLTIRRGTSLNRKAGRPGQRSTRCGISGMPALTSLTLA